MPKALLKKVVRRTRESPWALISVSWALLRGLLTVFYYRLRPGDVKIGWPLYVYGGWVSIRGPGRVRIGRGCLIAASAFRTLSIATLTPQARVTIGDRCRLAGAVIRCAHSITLEPRVMTGYCLIQDVDMVSAIETLPGDEPASRIVIGSGAWVTRQAVITTGTTIGSEAVVGVGSLCYRITVPPRTVTIGSPVLRSVPISGLVAMNVHT